MGQAKTRDEEFLAVLPPWEVQSGLPVIFCGYGYGSDAGPVNIGEANTFFDVQRLVANHNFHASNIHRMEVNGQRFFVAHNGII